MPRYAPAREDGLEPYVVDITEFGHKYIRIAYAKSKDHAEYDITGQMPYVYAHARRATPVDMEAPRCPR